MRIATISIPWSVHTYLLKCLIMWFKLSQILESSQIAQFTWNVYINNHHRAQYWIAEHANVWRLPVIGQSPVISGCSVLLLSHFHLRTFHGIENSIVLTSSSQGRTNSRGNWMLPLLKHQCQLAITLIKLIRNSYISWRVLELFSIVCKHLDTGECVNLGMFLYEG